MYKRQKINTRKRLGEDRLFGEQGSRKEKRDEKKREVGDRLWKRRKEGKEEGRKRRNKTKEGRVMENIRRGKRKRELCRGNRWKKTREDEEEDERK